MIKDSSESPERNLVNFEEKDERWQSYVRDESSLIKLHKNTFGSKGYRVSSDKSALRHHVSKMLKINLDKSNPALPKPYLIS